MVLLNQQRKGRFLTENPVRKILAGAKFQSCDLPTQIFFSLQPLLPHRPWPFSMAPHGRAHLCLSPMFKNQSPTFLLFKYIGVIGKVGSGKSSFLDALIGELNKVSGDIFVRDPTSGLGFVRQEPWIQKGTVKENVRKCFSIVICLLAFA